MTMHFWIPEPGEMPVPVGHDHPQAVPLVEAVSRSGLAEDVLRRLWTRTLGGVVAWQGAAGDAPGGAGDAAAAVSEAEADDERFRLYLFPWLAPEHAWAFREQCRAKGLNWRAGEAYPKLRARGGPDGGEVVMVCTTLELLRARARASGEYGGLDLEATFDPEGRLSSVTAVVSRWVPAAGTFREFRQTAYWDELYGYYLGPARLEGEPPAELSEEQRRGPFAPDVDAPLPVVKPRTCMDRAAEAMVLRAAFSAECGGLFVQEELGGAGGGRGTRSPKAKAATSPPYRGDTPTAGEEAPRTLSRLKVELFRLDDWDSARWEEAVAAARRARPGAGEPELCRRIWAEANRQPPR